MTLLNPSGGGLFEIVRSSPVASGFASIVTSPVIGTGTNRRTAASGPFVSSRP